MQKHGIIFDLDGTLWDVAETTFLSANEIAAEYGLNKVTMKAVLDSFGLPREGSAKNFFPDLPLCESVPYIDKVISRNIDNLFKSGGKLYSGVVETLETLNRDYDLFIVTNSPQRRYAESFIVSSGTQKLFKDYCSAGELGFTKAQAIKKTVEDNRLSKAVYIGDTETDEISATEAGIEFIYAAYGFGKVNNAEYVIGSIKELPKALEDVFDK